MIWCGPPRWPAGLPLTRLPYHLDEHFPGLCRIADFPRECDPRSLHTIVSFQAEVEAEAIDRGHLRLLCINASKPFGEQDERILMVVIHVLHDVALVLNQRIGLRFGII